MTADEPDATTGAEERRPRFCSRCGGSVAPDAAFCSRCGASTSGPGPVLAPAHASTSPTATPPPPPSPAPVPPSPSTNGLAIASLVLGILWLYWVGSILALVFGYIARRQIDDSGGRQGGRGIAIAGIVLGWIGIGVVGLGVLAIVAITFLGEEASDEFDDVGSQIGAPVIVVEDPDLEYEAVR